MILGSTFYGGSRAESYRSSDLRTNVALSRVGLGQSYRSSDLRTKVALSTVGLGQSLIDPGIYVQR